MSDLSHPVKLGRAGGPGEPIERPSSAEGAVLDAISDLARALKSLHDAPNRPVEAGDLDGLGDHFAERRRAMKLLTRAGASLAAGVEALDADLVSGAHAALAGHTDDLDPLKHWARTIEDGATRSLLLRALDERRFAELHRVVRSGVVRWQAPLDRAAGVAEGLDERAVELSLAIEALRPEVPGRALDAGAAMNAPDARAELLGSVVAITHFTQSGEKERAAFDGARTSYVFGDLRRLPFLDGWFDRIVCVSTLEHVGMDNSRYGGLEERDPRSVTGAVDELVRVLAPGGTMFITVPYGIPTDHGWYRVLGEDDVGVLEERLAGLRVERRSFRYDGSWVDGDPTADGRRDRRGMVAIRAVKAA